MKIVLNDGTVRECENKEEELHVLRHSAAHIMAQAVKDLSGCDIAIGTTAGIGRGGISVITDEYEIMATTDIYADLCENDSEKLFQRCENGIEKTLEILLLLLNNDFNRMKSLENIEIIKY
mgnify:CR=1 FL=1